MPLFTTQFLIDLVDMSHARKPEEVLQSYKNTAAKALGIKIAEVFPFVVTPYPNPQAVPTVAFTRDHEFKDKYSLELFIMTREERTEIAKLLYRIDRGMTYEDAEIEKALSILNK